MAIRSEDHHANIPSVPAATTNVKNAGQPQAQELNGNEVQGPAENGTTDADTLDMKPIIEHMSADIIDAQKPANTGQTIPEPAESANQDARSVTAEAEAPKPEPIMSGNK